MIEEYQYYQVLNENSELTAKVEELKADRATVGRNIQEMVISYSRTITELGEKLDTEIEMSRKLCRELAALKETE